MTFKELRKRKFSKKKLKHNKCRKDEYFDKKTKTCKTKTKGKSKRKTKVKKVLYTLILTELQTISRKILETLGS